MTQIISPDALREYEEIEDRFAEAAIKNFRGNLIFLISSGSFAYRGATKGRSDLDVMAVLKEDVRDMPRDDLRRMTHGFIDEYIAIHEEYDYALDDVFPGEYITPTNVRDAINGRGFETTTVGKLCLPKASNEYYLGSRENYYRAWRSMLAFSKKLAGNETQFQSAKLQAWETNIKYLLSSRDLRRVNRDSLLRILTSVEDKWESVGVTKKYLTFSEDEKEYVERVLTRLRIQGILDYSDDEFEVKNANLSQWENEIVESIGSGRIMQSSFLFSDEDDERFAEYTKREKARLSEKLEGVLETPRYSASPMINKYLGSCIQVVYSAKPEECEKNGLTDNSILIYVKTPNPDINGKNGKLFDGKDFKSRKVLMRVSSSCLHGSLGDTECSCHQDTVKALEMINENMAGVFIYMPQDAQGRGLRDKIRDHRLVYGVDHNGGSTQMRTTAESMQEVHSEGYDIRHYYVLAKVLKDLGLSEVEFTLLSNNDERADILRREAAIRISQTRAIVEDSVSSGLTHACLSKEALAESINNQQRRS